jgi:hypothetical protein
VPTVKSFCATGDAFCQSQYPSCDPEPSSSCNTGLATAAGFLPFVVVIVAFVGAIAWALRAPKAGHRGMWGPLAGSIVVLLGIGLNLLMNAAAIPGLFGNPV